MTVDIAVINAASTFVLRDKTVQSWIGPFQRYVNEHLVPHWNCPATLHFVPKNRKADPKMWWMVIANHTGDQGALGYHDDNPNGLPYAIIGAMDDARYGYSTTVTATHELGEMLVDPMIDQMVQVGGRAYLKEIADPVEADELGLKIDGAVCSDFCLPAYYDPLAVGPFDAQSVLTGNISVPALAPGGYISYEQNGIWHQIFARKIAGDKKGDFSYRALRRGRSYKKSRH